jgi:Fur family iron response transcriptional regulator
MQEMATSRQQAEQILRDRGVQPTAQRVEVLYLLHTCCRHVGADEVFERLNEEFTKVSRATVYNTLNLLRDRGLLTEVVIGPGKVLYDGNTVPHYHFYNVDTHAVIDVPMTHVGFTCLPVLPEGMTFRGLDVVIKVAGAG